MTNYPRQFAFCLILACTVGAVLAQSLSAPLQYADDFAALGRSTAATNTPFMLVFTRPGCPFCARATQDHLLEQAIDAARLRLRAPAR